MIKEVAAQPRYLNAFDEDIEPIPELVELYASAFRQDNASSRARSRQDDNGNTRSRPDPVEEHVREGNRNAFLFSLAGTMRRRGMSEEAIFAALKAENEAKCVPPLPEAEVGDIAHGIGRYEVEEPCYKASSTVPEFPLSALPPVLRRMVEEAAASIVCPPELVAVPMLAILGSAIGNSRAIRLKNGYTQGATLYAAVVADPGSKKSPAFMEAPAREGLRPAVLALLLVELPGFRGP